MTGSPFNGKIVSIQCVEFNVLDSFPMAALQMSTNSVPHNDTHVWIHTSLGQKPRWLDWVFCIWCHKTKVIRSFANVGEDCIQSHSGWRVIPCSYRTNVPFIFSNDKPPSQQISLMLWVSLTSATTLRKLSAHLIRSGFPEKSPSHEVYWLVTLWKMCISTFATQYNLIMVCYFIVFHCQGLGKKTLRGHSRFLGE